MRDLEEFLDKVLGYVQMTFIEFRTHYQVYQVRMYVTDSGTPISCMTSYIFLLIEKQNFWWVFTCKLDTHGSHFDYIQRDGQLNDVL